MTDAELIKKYIELRDRKEALEKEQKLAVAKFTSAMETIADVMSARLLAEGQESVRTEFGTAFRQETLSTKVADREALFHYVREHDAYDLLTAAVSKEAVKEFLETSNGLPPPGVEITTIHKTLFRRA